MDSPHEKGQNPEPCLFKPCVTQEISKIVEHYTLFCKKVRTTTVKSNKMDKNKPCNNLGPPRTHKRNIINKYLIGLRYQKFSF